MWAVQVAQIQPPALDCSDTGCSLLMKGIKSRQKSHSVIVLIPVKEWWTSQDSRGQNEAPLSAAGKHHSF